MMWRKHGLELWFGSFSSEKNYPTENQKDSASFLLDLNEFSSFLKTFASYKGILLMVSLTKTWPI